MSYDNYYDVIINTKSHQKEMMRRAERERLAEIARQHRSETPAYRPMLATVGNTLVRLGMDLKERAGAVAEMDPVPVRQRRIAG